MFFNNIGSSSKHQIYMTFQNMFVIFFRTTIYFFYFFPVSQMPLSVWVFLLEHSASLCELSYNPPDYSETFSSLAISEKDRNKLPYCIQFHMCILNSVSFLWWYNSDSTITQLTSAHFLFFFSQDAECTEAGNHQLIHDMTLCSVHVFTVMCSTIHVVDTACRC